MKRPKSLTTEEVAEIAGVTRRTVYAWVTGGLLPAHKAGPKLWRVYADVLTAYLARGAEAAKNADDRIQGRLMATVPTLPAPETFGPLRVKPATVPLKPAPKPAPARSPVAVAVPGLHPVQSATSQVFTPAPSAGNGQSKAKTQQANKSKASNRRR